MRLLKKTGWICCLLAPLLLQAKPATTEQGVQSIPRIATVDWTVAETLLALGITPGR